MPGDFFKFLYFGLKSAKNDPIYISGKEYPILRAAFFERIAPLREGGTGQWKQREVRTRNGYCRKKLSRREAVILFKEE